MKTLKQLHTMHAATANVDCSTGVYILHGQGVDTPDKLTAHTLDVTAGVGASTARGLVAILALEVTRLNNKLAAALAALEN